MALPPLEIEVLAKFDEFKDAMEKVRGDLDKTSEAAGRTQSAFSKAAAGIKKLKGPVSAAAAAITAAGAAAFGLASSTAKAGDSAAKTADKLGVGIEALQELRFAAERSGVASNSFDNSLQRLTRRISEAAQGSGVAKDAIAELGLDAAALATKSPDEALTDIADRMALVENQTERVRLAFKLFDRDGVGMVNMLQGGSEGLEDMRQVARDTGAVIGEDAARASEQFQDKMQDLKASFAGLRNEIGEKLIPIFVETVIPVLVDQVIPAIVKVIDVISKIGPSMTAAKEILQTSIENIRTSFDEWMTYFAELPAQFLQYGRDVIAGFGDGIKAKFAEIKDGLLSPFKEFGSNVKGFFGISSPSKLFTQFGEWVGQGFAMGVEGQSGRIQQSAQVFDEFTNKAQGALAKNRKIAAAEAFINAARAASQVLANPAVPWFQKIGAAASVFAAGKQFATAIESGSKSMGGSASGGMGSSTTTAPAPAPLDVRVAGLGASDLISGAALSDLFDRLQDEAGDRGFTVSFAT